MQEVETLLEKQGTQADGLQLIKKVEEDTEGNMGLINLDLHARLKAYCFSKIFELDTKLSALEFIRHIKKEMPKELKIDPILIQDELQIADLARRVKNFETR